MSSDESQSPQVSLPHAGGQQVDHASVAASQAGSQAYSGISNEAQTSSLQLPVMLLFYQATLLNQAVSVHNEQVTSSALEDGSEITFGIPIEDTSFAKNVRRVIVLTVIAVSYYVSYFISNLLRGAYPNTDDSLWRGLSSLLIDVSIPVFGYHAALHGNRQLACCYFSCNLFVTILNIVAFVRIERRMEETNGNCENEAYSQLRRYCENWVSNGLDRYITYIGTGIATSLGCLSFWFGYRLYQQLSLGVMAEPLVGEVISLGSPTMPRSVEVVAPTNTHASSDSRDTLVETAGDAMQSNAPVRPTGESSNHP